MRKFLKNWGTLTVAIFALLASVYAVCSDNINLENTSKLIEERYNELDE